MSASPARGILALMAGLQRMAALAHSEGREEMSRALFAMSEKIRIEVFPDNPPLDPRFEHEDERR